MRTQVIANPCPADGMVEGKVLGKLAVCRTLSKVFSVAVIMVWTSMESSLSSGVT